MVDASILTHVIDLLNNILKFANSEEERTSIATVFPKLLQYTEKTDDMFLLLNGTQALKQFIYLASKEVVKVCQPE